MKNLKVGLLGSEGKMGKEIIRLLSKHDEAELFYPIDRGEKWNEKKAKNVDVWIDFSNPNALANLLARATATNTPVVCGTTGFSANEKTILKKSSQKIPILWSSNMSLGVAVLNEALKTLKAIRHFDFQVEEFHHRHKKDKPSGTAITLQENLEKIIAKKMPEPLSVRGGGIFGVHKIYAMSEEETLVFEHVALNREVFAKGAIHAAQWLAKKKKPGLYQIRDVLFDF